ncbi:uncharacterized protein [Cicer arietinum]|uniref:Uncharacterized protein LOC101502267 isoform X1 n=2 Tax=Cicer arietinum TaxID=3827 RepID=A0A1S2YLF9_CICAR|nr:uncharacterized protein LOC101502267 isoform X1 [Cicer arietinum]XP_004506421.1 uncharacterized protein LOC101502267 isoform X1 [Cicer arietinum]XP_004506422.1 uncharacterized protein LOC101502267 isoform X1 [Cicer arietinum]
MSDLPFQVGEVIESKSFQNGFRGAWFRCKIIKICKKGGEMYYLLEYPDYPDQGRSQIKLYQITSHISKSKGFNKELMVRPRFPTIYRESEKLDVSAISEVIVIVDDAWKVGDFVDWFTDGCYWCGKVTEISGNDKVQIDLLPPPLGEGSSYEALNKDLRPSLDWSLEKGWTVPMPKEDGCRCPARIMNPANSDAIAANYLNIKATTNCVLTQKAITNGAMNVGQPSYKSMKRRKKCNSVENGMDIEEADNQKGGTTMPASIENLERTTINAGYNVEYPAKKMRSNSSLCLNSMSSNSIEAAILDLEELVNRIKWLRDVLHCEVPMSGTKHPSWEFLQHHAPCK